MLNGKEYATVEHAYQASKALYSYDQERIRACHSPMAAKHLGRGVVRRKDWEEVRENIMLQCLRAKFVPGSTLAFWLVQTGDAELVEINTWGDTFWGVFCGEGQNRLGQLLMQVRDEIQAQ